MASYVNHRGASKAPKRTTPAQDLHSLKRDLGMVERKTKPKKAKPKVPAKAAGAVASSPSTVSLEDAVAKLRAALQR